MLATLPVMIIAAILFCLSVASNARKTVAESNTIVQETPTGIISVKSFANEAWEVVRYLNSIKDIRSSCAGPSGAERLPLHHPVHFRGHHPGDFQRGRIDDGRRPAEHFFTFLMTGLVAGSIGGIMAQFSALQRGLGAIESLMELMEESREEVVTQQDQAYPALQLRGDGSLRMCTFTMPTAPM